MKRLVEHPVLIFCEYQPYELHIWPTTTFISQDELNT